MTDADGFSTTVQYNFDFGARTRVQGPPPANQPQGLIQTFIYDASARLDRVTTANNGAYTRFVYGPDYVQSFATVSNVADEAYAIQVFDGVGRVRAAAGNHPGSAGGYSAQNMIYDSMGRAVKQSNPTEINGAWVPAGDDAAGWLYAQQSYNWQGRPLITTNPDGTTKEASYSGCGCAGGEVVTVTDEGTLSGGVAKKRQQKIYADVLGRTVKTEALNWDGAGAYGTGGSVYSAVVNVYNGRDQVTSVKQYAGAATTDGSCPSGTCQQTTMTYDGHGRLKTRHAPEQNAGTATTYNYNSDDTVLSVADARGATQTFGYNARRLVTGISYSAPAGITIPAAVSFTYDGLGNRTAMTDGMGSASYNYNQLSRMTSETRSFTGLSGSFTLNYGYNLAGELSSFTDPFGAQVGYNYDQTGRLSGVTGSGFASVSTYASNAQYRAWGALKSLAYGNTKTLSVGYNNALQATSYEVPGILKKSYQYNDDGRVKFTQDQLTTNSKFDRSYEYDHMGRVIKGLSGAEARGGAATDDRPYNETLAYDAMNHLTMLDRRNWDRWDGSGPDTFVNNRVQGWIYDADGRALSTSIGYYTYDAAGRVRSFGDDAPYKTQQEFTGEGRRAKTVAQRYDEPLDQFVTEKVTYYLTSTVLGGALVTELSEQGAKERTLVHAGGSVLASQKITSGTESVEWEHRDASGASYRVTNSAGDWTQPAEMDAVGANAGMFKPFTWNVPDKQGLPVPYPGVADMINNPGGACVADGVPIPCYMLTENNSLECPNGDCHPEVVYNSITGRDELTPVSQNPNNGQLGFWPNGGNGPGVVITSSGQSIWVSVSSDPHSVDVWKWICVPGQGCAFGPEPTAYSGSSYFELTGFSPYGSSLPQNTLTIEHFTAAQESWIRYEMRFILTPKCDRAYEAEKLNSPSSIISDRGVVIRHAKDLGERSAADLGLDPRTYRDAQTKINSGQGGTVFGIDGTLQIYLNSYAFVGPSWDGKYFSLAETLKHEFIHEGIREWRSPWHPFSHDLRGFPGYDRIMEGCK